MVKVVSIFKLKPGFDPDDSYRLWLEEHTVYVKAKLKPELKKYLIGRVVTNLGEKVEEFGFGVVELFFEDVDSALRAMNRLWSVPGQARHNVEYDEFTRRIAVLRRAIIEEKEIEL